MYVDQFGFIGERLDLLIERGQVRTLPQFEEAKALLEKCSNRDGYLYPPLAHQQTLDFGGSPKKIHRTERPALLHRIPASHEIRLFDAPGDAEAGRYGEGGFAVHFLGFLLGWRCQFFNWWVDGRIPTKSHSDCFVHLPCIVSICLDHARSRWASWPSRDRTVLVNALFLHNRTGVYEWDWERFQAEYQVLDALYAIARRRHGVTARSHRDRIRALCDHFGLFRNDLLGEQIVTLRNELIHEALWGGQMPGTAPQGTFHMPIWLHRFNQRLVLGILEIDAEYVHSNWQSLGEFSFSLRTARVRPN